MITLIQADTTPLIAFLTLLSNIIFVTVVVAMIVHVGTRARLYNFVHKYILELIFWSVLSAVVGSLVYSQIIGYPPCELCWIQRICLYPQLIIVYMAMRRKDKTIIDYLVPLSVIGAVVALYQSFIQWGFDFGSAVGCANLGGECAKVFFKEYSYITIPFMSFTIFIYIITLKFIYYHKNRSLR